MAREVLPKAERAEVRELAQGILVSQREEVQKRRARWQQRHPDLPPPGPGRATSAATVTPQARSDDPERGTTATPSG